MHTVAAGVSVGAAAIVPERLPQMSHELQFGVFPLRERHPPVPLYFINKLLR